MFDFHLKRELNNISREPAYMLNKYQSVRDFRGICMKVHSGQYCSTICKIKQVFKWSSSCQVDLQYFVTEMFRWKEIWYSKFTVPIQEHVKEWRESLVWLLRKSMLVMKRFQIIHWVKFSPIWSPRHSLETGCIFTEFCVVIKRKYIDSRNIVNFEIHLLLLVAGLLEDKAFRKGLVDDYIFHQPIALS